MCVLAWSFLTLFSSIFLNKGVLTSRNFSKSVSLRKKSGCIVLLFCSSYCKLWMDLMQILIINSLFLVVFGGSAI